MSNCAKAGAFFAEAFASSGENDQEKVGRRPPFPFARLRQFPQAGYPARGACLAPEFGFLDFLRARIVPERRSGLGTDWSTPWRRVGASVRRSSGLLQRLGLGLGPSHGASLQFDTVRIVEETITDRIGLVRVTDNSVPVRYRELAGNQDGGAFAAFLDDFDQISTFGVAQRGQEPVVDGEQIGLGQSSQNSGVGAVTPTDRQLVQ